MKARAVGFRVVSLLGLAFASLLVTDDMRRAPAFCPYESGCAAVTTSPYGRPLGIPLSTIGLAAFGTFYALTLFPGTIADRIQGPLALVAGVTGLALLAIQWLILQQICRFCLVADAAGILLAAV